MTFEAAYSWTGLLELLDDHEVGAAPGAPVAGGDRVEGALWSGPGRACLAEARLSPVARQGPNPLCVTLRASRMPTV